MHHYQLEMLIEIESSNSDGDEIETYNDKEIKTINFIVVLMPAVIAMMTGIRGLIPFP